VTAILPPSGAYHLGVEANAQGVLS